METKAFKWITIILFFVGFGLGIGCVLIDGKDKKNNTTSNSNTLKELPKPELSEGQRGELGIDKNINESNIDEYLGREDAVYRDMRMLEDPATYENIGGDRFLSGYIKGFEVTPLPYIIPVDGLPKEVGKTYTGETLFSYVNNTYVANYKESMSIIEKIFPKDKVIFLMCGGGGYAGMTKNFLVQLGWNENKIYNVGGYWYYEGKNKVEVKKIVDGKVTYDFDNVPYNKIDFSKLTKIDNRVELSSEFYNVDNFNVPKNTLMHDFYVTDTREGYYPGMPTDSPDTPEQYEIDVENAIKYKGGLINKLMEQKKSFVVQVHAGDTCINYASESNSFDRYTQDYFYEKNVFIFNMGLSPLKASNLYKTVKYNPAVIIVKNGEIYKYVDANMDEYTELSKSKAATVKWLEANIVFK